MDSPKPAPRVPPLPYARPVSSPVSDADWLALVRAKVAGLTHGTVQIVVHDGRITQVESTEKIRLQSPPRTP